MQWPHRITPVARVPQHSLKYTCSTTISRFGYNKLQMQKSRECAAQERYIPKKSWKQRYHMSYLEFLEWNKELIVDDFELLSVISKDMWEIFASMKERQHEILILFQFT